MNDATDMKYWDLPSIEMQKTKKSITPLQVDALLLVLSMESQMTM